MKPSPFLERNEFFSKSFFEASYFHEVVCVGGSAFNNNRFVGKGRNSRRGVLEVIDGGVAALACRVHGAKRGVVAEHTLLRLKAVVENECIGVQKSCQRL